MLKHQINICNDVLLWKRSIACAIALTVKKLYCAANFNSWIDACTSIEFIRYFEFCQEAKSRIYHYMQQAETKLVGNLRLDRHEMPSPYNYKFPLD